MVHAGAGWDRGRQLGDAGGDETVAEADGDAAEHERERKR